MTKIIEIKNNYILHDWYKFYLNAYILPVENNMSDLIMPRKD